MIIFSDDDDGRRWYPVVNWELWFAWHPVRVGTKWVWLKLVARARNEQESVLGEAPYVYGPAHNVLTQR